MKRFLLSLGLTLCVILPTVIMWFFPSTIIPFLIFLFVVVLGVLFATAYFGIFKVVGKAKEEETQ